ncbi:MAG: tetratricopeptide repeat protein [Desulfobacter sp.]
MPRNLTPKCLKSLLKLIGNLSRTGMTAGNAGDFDKAFLNLEDALCYARELDKKCLEAKLLNNLGILHTMYGEWDKAFLMYDKSLAIVADHYGTDNFLYKTLQKNMGYLLNLDVAAA